MPNASNTSRVLGAIGGHDVTAERAVLAVQGPSSRATLARVFPEAAAVAHFRVETLDWRGAPVVVGGTGYTGEDGVECAVPAGIATEFWEAVVTAGAVPAGLGARDTLRLEAGLPLHGHELGPGITPLEAGLSWVVGWDKPGGFTGRDALVEQRRTGRAASAQGYRGRNSPAITGRVRPRSRGGPSGRVDQRQFFTRARVWHRFGVLTPGHAGRRRAGCRGPGEGAARSYHSPSLYQKRPLAPLVWIELRRDRRKND